MTNQTSRSRRPTFFLSTRIRTQPAEIVPNSTRVSAARTVSPGSPIVWLLSLWFLANSRRDTFCSERSNKKTRGSFPSQKNHQKNHQENSEVGTSNESRRTQAATIFFSLRRWLGSRPALPLFNLLHHFSNPPVFFFSFLSIPSSLPPQRLLAFHWDFNFRH